MVKQAVEDIGRLVRRRRNYFDVIRAVLVREVGVEAETGINAVAGVDVAARGAALSAAEELPVRA